MGPDLLTLRRHKSPWELARLEEAARVAAEVYRHGAEILRPGLTEAAFAGRLFARAMELGHEGTLRSRGGFEAYSWIGIFAPAATPAPAVRKLTEDFQAALRHEEVARKLTDAGFEVMATDGPSLDRFAIGQFERWSDFVRKTGLKVEE